MKKISFTFKAFMCSLIFFAQAAYAAKWSMIDRTEKSYTFIDLDSIKIIEKNLRQAWFLITYDDTQKTEGYPEYKSLKVLVKFDCKNETMGAIKEILYSGDNGGGETVFSEERTRKLSAYVPDTIGESRFIAACKGKIKK